MWAKRKESEKAPRAGGFMQQSGLSLPSIPFPQMFPRPANTPDCVLWRGIATVREFFGLTMALYLLAVIFPGSEIPLPQKLSAYAYVFLAGVATYQSRTSLHRDRAIRAHLFGFAIFTLGNAAYSYFAAGNVMNAIFWSVWLPGVFTERAIAVMPVTGGRLVMSVFSALVALVVGCFVWTTLASPRHVTDELFLLIPIAHVGSINVLYLIAAVGDNFARSIANNQAELLRAREATERRLNAELAATRQQLERMNRSLTMSALAASIAHEISQPLAAVVTNAGAALRWIENDNAPFTEAREALVRVVEDGHRASAVIGSIRAMLGQSAPKRARLNMRELVDEALDVLEPEIRKHEVTVLRPEPQDAPPIYGDRIQLRQVILNLLANGIEAMANVIDRPRLLIIRSRRDDHLRVVLCVEDSGTGIAIKDPARVFEAYFTTKSKGMGMGLFISRMIIEAHGGAITVDSRLGRTRFHIAIPADNLHG
jgi:signal transduction histidine kinase